MEIEKQLNQYFEKKYSLNEEDFKNGFKLADYMDSLGMFEFLIFIEQELELKIDPLEIDEENFGDYESSLKFIILNKHHKP
jgi:acyl carrier protein